MKTETDYLIIGSGFFGTVMAERISRVFKKRVLVLEKRPHIGGNCFSEIDQETGIEFHRYGTHIFHTDSDKIFHYLSQFTSFNGYYHQVLTTHKDQVFQLPINLETINQFFGTHLKPFEVEDFLQSKRVQIASPQNFEEKAISLIGRELYQAFIKGYTQKHWGKDPTELPASILHRLPIRTNYNESYFKNDRYQGIPSDGYTPIFEKMLDHPLIQVKTETDFFAERDQIKVLEKTIYTGPIDRYFSYQHGKLDWRSIQLKREVKPYSDFQGTSVMNYADAGVPYTRVHEPKHLHPERDYPTDKTLTFYEYPLENEEEPFYPINDEKNKKLYSLYLKESKKEKNVIFGGRLGTYAYLDMDQVIAQALATFSKLEAELSS